MTFAAQAFDRERWQRFADSVAVALVVSLPWSTSATGILAAVWLIAVVPTLDGASVRRIMLTPAGGLPVLLCILAVVGMAWATGLPMAERWEGLKSFLKLLAIPLLMVQFQRSGRGQWVAYGFLISCAVLLALSWLLALVPGVPWPWRGKGPIGVPIKDYIAQSGELTICAAMLGWLALKAWRERRRGVAVGWLVVIAVIVLNILMVATSRTALVVIPVVALLFAYWHFSTRTMVAFVLAVIVAAALAWTFAGPMRNNVVTMFHEVESFKPTGEETRAGTRLEFWRKSIGFIAEAPLIGHGTGSIRDQYRRTVGESGMAALASSNPHNQTLAVGIQLGLLGAVVMFAMWLAHVVLFWRSGFVAWVGLAIVAQNIVGSLFNSHLFDFAHGWGYVLGVGITGGMMLRQVAAKPNG
ncbi:MAG: O-antigen ligase family protein [Rhizobiales bacterium]|nr:O-antigen ligase family protein [Hyphomicrobiales bacterium]